MNLNKTRLQTAIYNNLHWQQPTPCQQAQMPFAVGGLIGASLFTAGVAVSVTSVVATIAIVATVAGAALTVVGLVTGNEQLTHIGAMIGLAGGVASLGVSALGAGASVAGQAATKAGETAAVEGTKAAVKTAAPAVIKSGAQTAGTSALVDVGAKAVGTAGAAKGALSTGTAPVVNKPVFTPAPSTGSASAGTVTVSGPQAAPVIQADVATGSTAAKGATDAAAAQGSFFDFLGKPNTVGSELGGSVLTGAATMYGNYQTAQTNQANNDVVNKLNRDTFDRNSTIQDRQSAITDRQYANANSQGRLDFSSRGLTPEEWANAQRDNSPLQNQGRVDSTYRSQTQTKEEMDAEQLADALRMKRNAGILSGAPA